MEVEEIKSLLLRSHSMLERELLLAKEGDNEYEIRNIIISIKHLENCYKRVDNIVVVDPECR